MARRPYGINPSTRFNGPLVGSASSGDGLYRDVALGPLDSVRDAYQLWVEDFKDDVVDTAELITSGGTNTALNTPTANTVSVSAATGFLTLNPGTAVSSGTHLALTTTPTAASLNKPLEVPRSGITSTTALMTGKELIWAARVGFISSTAAAWSGSAILGWLAADTSPMDAAGVPTVIAGGGAGFHISTAGVISFFGQQGAITAVPARLTGSTVGTLAVATPRWFELGFRAKWISSAAGTGQIEYYVNNKFVGRITSGLPMQSTEVYGSTFAVQNGATAQLVDLAIDYVVTAISRSA